MVLIRVPEVANSLSVPCYRSSIRENGMEDGEMAE
jgi:hypothetical protein